MLKLVVDNGFVFMILLVLVCLEVMVGMGFLGVYVEEVYWVEGDGFYFVGIFEVLLVGYYFGEILDFFCGLLWYVGWLLCF